MTRQLHRRSGERDNPGAGHVLDNPLILSLARRVIFGLPGYQFSYDIINFLNATFLPRDRRTYRYYIVANSGLIYLKYPKGSRSHIEV
jgi:hypothetical protein